MIGSEAAGQKGDQRAWIAHMAGLQASYTRHVKQDPGRKDPRIEELLTTTLNGHSGQSPNWAIPNEIEILLVQLKTGADLEVALDSALLTAERIAVPSFAALNARRKGFEKEEEKQALLAKLLRDTHNRYAARRSERVERTAAAKRMAWLGGGLTAVVIGALVVLGVGIKVSGDTALGYELLSKYNICVTTFFGFLGAYLSRLIAFKNGAAQLSFDDLENGYAWHFLFVRLLVGGLSALVVYFVIAGRLIGGELFPDPGEGAASGFGVLWQAFEDDSYTGPTANFAKLIVWCFIAGFSERFLPDSLSALEAKSRG
jgi:hypothetical protein